MYLNLRPNAKGLIGVRSCTWSISCFSLLVMAGSAICFRYVIIVSGLVELLFQYGIVVLPTKEK
jgi:hypothetical protein